jgi:NADH-quinone oxidoreductase subunit E
MATVTTPILTDEMIAAINSYIPRYPSKQAVVLPALHIVNDRLRYVPFEAVIEIAALLGLAPAQVQDTLSFYGYFKQDAPHGEVRAWVCRSVACALRGADDLLEHICHKAGIQPGQCTPNGKLTIEFGECLGACEMAPCILEGDDLVADVTHEKADAMLEKYK